MKSLSRRMTALVTVLMLFTGCTTDDMQTMYSRYRASFFYQKVMQVQPLYASLTGSGQFCTIAFQGMNVTFSSNGTSYTDNLTQVAGYQSPVFLGGFIVGQANMPETGQTNLPLMCYDLACPNCYNEMGLTRHMSVMEYNGKQVASCSKCKRKYDLNNTGIPIEGEKGLKLERYHIVYDGSNIMRIYNP